MDGCPSDEMNKISCLAQLAARSISHKKERHISFSFQLSFPVSITGAVHYSVSLIFILLNKISDSLLSIEFINNFTASKLTLL